jgi:penicillin-binding protein 1A
MPRLLSKIAAVILCTGVVLAVATAALAVPAGMVGTAGSGEPEAIELGPLAQRSYVYAADGALMATLKDEENRQPVPLDEVPSHVIDAIVAVEDAGFWVHDGYDVRGMLRAFVANVDSGGISQGGSTITQQLVKLNLLSNEQTVDRKVQEVILAQRLEKQMSKEEILHRYLNTVYFGNHSYGIQAAAETYFGVSASELDVGQAALLAGIIRNPVTYNPARYPERAENRRVVAIERMRDTGALSDEDAEFWEAAPTAPEIHQVLPKANDYFPSEVEQQLLNHPRFAMLGETDAERHKAVYQGGLKVYTTYDPAAQQQALAARDSQLPLENGVFTQAGVNPETGEPNQGSAAVVSVEPATGAVRTMVGGPGFDNYKFNLATQNRRQVGSSFKTYVLASLMEQGHSPEDIINGTMPCRFAHENSEGGVYEPGNYADGGGSIGTITSQTLSSSNCAYVRLGLIAGLPDVAEMAYQLGIPRTRATADGEGTPTVCDTCPSTPLGVADLTPLEMASAYATIANDGVYNAPYLIDRVENRHGKVIYEHTPDPQRRLSAESARLVTRVLEQNVQSGTGTAARVPGQQVAGKTGTTNDSTDGWFVGYTPSLSTAVWVGGLGSKFTINVGGRNITGGSYPAQIWGAFMNAWQEGRESVAFPAPPSRGPGELLGVPGGIDLTPPPPPPAPEGPPEGGELPPPPDGDAPPPPPPPPDAAAQPANVQAPPPPPPPPPPTTAVPPPPPTTVPETPPPEGDG